MAQNQKKKKSQKDLVVGVVGLGYVGLPLVVGFAKKGLKVIAYDVSEKRVGELRNFNDSTGEVLKEDLMRVTKTKRIKFVCGARSLSVCDFILITVPTPTKNNIPDLSYVKSACEIIGANMKKGVTVVLESTVWPGTTENIAAKILAAKSGYVLGSDFKVGYSPERINPGDRKHTLDKIIKVVSGMDDDSTQKLAALYSLVSRDVHVTPNIMVAEMAKVTENIFRDVNIGLANEFAMIANLLKISVRDVEAAAATKWNWGGFRAGLVGGHCIPEDPHFLAHRAIQLGYHPELILAGRRKNDSMPKYIAEETVKALSVLSGSGNKDILIVGLTFKENVRDLRNSPAKKLINELKAFGMHVEAFDPMVDKHVANKEFGIVVHDSFGDLPATFRCMILTVVHDQFKKIPFSTLMNFGSSPERKLFFDVRGSFRDKRDEIEGKNIQYLSL